MSTKRETLLSDDYMQGVSLGYYTKEHVRKYHSAKEMYNASYVAVNKVRDIYEEARAKDMELIQQLVYWLHRVKSLPDVDADERCWMGDDALAAAAAQGFKPSEP